MREQMEGEKEKEVYAEKKEEKETEGGNKRDKQ